ncbi:MAG: RNA polymerase subunit sigma-70 [Planctomyces sp.]|nr:RNA polymerase subunit sigma-70 [Planctomyces sp.]
MSQDSPEIPAGISVDAWFMARIRAQDAQAWSELVALHEPRLFAWMKSRLGDAATAEDLVQEVFFSFLRALPHFDDTRPIEPFLNQIAAHLLIDTLRRQGRRRAFSLSGETPESEGGAIPHVDARQRKASSLHRGRETAAAIESCLATSLEELASRWQSRGEFERLKCCELLFALGYPNQRAAKTLAISEQAVANHKSYILQQLRTRLTKAGLSDAAIAELI